MIIRIILNNFFKKYNMNKKTIHILTHKLPIISIIILILAYAYLNIPENYVLQLGGSVPGKNLIPLPNNTPWKYKYRWVLVAMPFLIIIITIYAAIKSQKLKSLTLWDLGGDFFYQFQKQVNNAVKSGSVESIKATSFSWKEVSDRN